MGEGYVLSSWSLETWRKGNAFYWNNNNNNNDNNKTYSVFPFKPFFNACPTLPLWILQFWRRRVLPIKKLRFNLSLGVNAPLKTLDRSWPINWGVHFESIAPPSKRIFPLWKMWGVAWKDITKNCFFPPFSLKFWRERLFVECTDNTIHV